MPRPRPTRTKAGFVRSYGDAIKALRREALRYAKDAARESAFDTLHGATLLYGGAFCLAADFLASLPDREPKPGTKGRGKR